MLELLGGVASAILGGGATGLLGIVVQRFFDHQKLKADIALEEVRNKHALALRAVDLQQTQAEWAGREKVAVEEGKAAENVADAEALKASYQMEPKQYSAGIQQNWFTSSALVLLDVLRGMVRPGLTLYLAWIATKVYNESAAAVAKIDPALMQAVLGDVFKQTVVTLLYLFTTCVLWWFGTRNKQKAPGA